MPAKDILDSCDAARKRIVEFQALGWMAETHG